jgi:hypothetical protein
MQGYIIIGKMCDKNPDVDYYNCPPRMSDGRWTTDYRPRCAANFESMPKPMMSAYDYRQYLIDHAEEMMDKNRNIADVMASCLSCVREPVIELEKHVQHCNKRVCTFEPNDQKYKSNNGDEFMSWDGSYTVPHKITT